MPKKNYGRLVGSTAADSARAETSKPSGRFPYASQSPGTKLIAITETNGSVNLNRPFVALAENQAHLEMILGAPALKQDILPPRRDNSGSPSGFTTLAGVSPGQLEIPLTGGGGAVPIAWVYHGLRKENVGRYIQLYRAKADEHAEDLSPEDFDKAQMVTPTDVLYGYGSGGTSLFPTVAAVGDRDHAHPTAIPHIRVLDDTEAPYDAGPVPLGASSWEHDGVRITTVRWAELYARPGCFLYVSNAETASNNGLWYIESIIEAEDSVDGNKVILSRGYLHKVTVTDATNFSAGDRVTWRPIPEHDNAVGSTTLNRTASAYIAFRDGDDLYLVDELGYESFAHTATNQDALVNTDNATHLRYLASGSLGFQDEEPNATENWVMPIGTILYSAVSGASSDVVSSVAAGSGHVFSEESTSSTQVQVCNPLGFWLNPGLLFTVNSVDPDPYLLGGDYYVTCSTLSTVREKLTQGGADIARGVTHGGTAGMTAAARQYLLSALTAMRTGAQSYSTGTDTSSHGFAPAARRLGSDRWVVEVSHPSSTVFETWWIGQGSPQEITWGTSQLVRAQVVHVDGNTIVMSRARAVDWAPVAPYAEELLKAGSVLTGTRLDDLGGSFFYISTMVDYPRVSISDGAGGLISDAQDISTGLDAAYNNMFDSDPKARGAGQGNRIYAEEDKPPTSSNALTAADQTAWRALVGGTNPMGFEVSDVSGGGTIAALGEYTGSGSGGASAILRAEAGNLALGNEDLSVIGGRIRFPASTLDSETSIAFNDANVGWTSAERIRLSDGSPFHEFPVQARQVSDSIIGGLHAATPGGLVSSSKFAAVRDGFVRCASTHNEPFFAETASVGNATTNGPGSTFYNTDGAAPSIGATIRVQTANEVGGELSQWEHFEVLNVTGTGPYTVDLANADTFTYYDIDASPTTYALPVEQFTDPLTLKHREMYLMDRGALVRLAEGDHTVALPASSTRYIYYSGGTLVASAAVLSESVGLIYLAKVVTGPYSIESIEYAFVKSSEAGQEHWITIGDIAGSSYEKDGAHFRTIGEALAHVREWDDAAPAGRERSFVLAVLADTEEVWDSERGLTFPYQLPAVSRVRIVGVGEYGGDIPTVTWDRPYPLINLTESLVVEDLAFTYLGSFPADGYDRLNNEMGITPFYCNSSSPTQFRLSRVQVYGGHTAATLMQITSDRITIENCYFRDQTISGVVLDLADADYTSIYGNLIDLGGVSPGTVPGLDFLQAGIYVSASKRLFVENNIILEPITSGIYITSADAFISSEGRALQVQKNAIFGLRNNAAGSPITYGGLYVDGGNSGFGDGPLGSYAVNSNQVVDAPARGIYAKLYAGSISHNTVYRSSTLTVVASTLLDVNGSQDCTLTGNVVVDESTPDSPYPSVVGLSLDTTNGCTVVGGYVELAYNEDNAYCIAAPGAYDLRLMGVETYGGTTGVYAYSNTQNVTMSNLLITDPKDYGINVIFTTSPVLLSDCKISSSLSDVSGVRAYSVSSLVMHAMDIDLPLEVSTTTGYGIELEEVASLAASLCVVTGGENGVKGTYSSTASDQAFMGCTFEDQYESSVRLDDYDATNHVTFTSCKMMGSLTGAGLYVESLSAAASPPAKVSLTDSLVYACNFGVLPFFEGEVRITGCTFDSITGGGAGIVYGGNDYAGARLVFSNNEIVRISSAGAGYSCVDVYAEGAEVSDNTFRNVACSGIRLMNGSNSSALKAHVSGAHFYDLFDAVTAASVYAVYVDAIAGPWVVSDVTVAKHSSAAGTTSRYGFFAAAVAISNLEDTAVVKDCVFYDCDVATSGARNRLSLANVETVEGGLTITSSDARLTDIRTQSAGKNISLTGDDVRVLGSSLRGLNVTTTLNDSDVIGCVLGGSNSTTLSSDNATSQSKYKSCTLLGAATVQGVRISLESCTLNGDVTFDMTAATYGGYRATNNTGIGYNLDFTGQGVAAYNVYVVGNTLGIPGGGGDILGSVSGSRSFDFYSTGNVVDDSSLANYGGTDQYNYNLDV